VRMLAGQVRCWGKGEAGSQSKPQLVQLEGGPSGVMASRTRSIPR